MDSLSLGLTPHGHLGLFHDAATLGLDAGLMERLVRAFERGSGHGLLLLGADEVGSALPPVHAYWRGFGSWYVTALCTQQDIDGAPRKIHVAAPPDEELQQVVRAAPPMIGAEYLSPVVLHALWQELDVAFRIELSESQCGVQDFLRRRNSAWNLVCRVHFNLAENRKDSDSP